MTTTTTTMRMTGLTERTFGVELELLLPESQRGSAGRQWLAAQVAAAGTPCTFEGYTHRITSGWKVVTDGSLDHTFGAEIVSPILKGEDGLRQVEQVCAVLMAAGCRIRRSCGVHVHHGVRDFNAKGIRTLARLVHRFAPVVDGLVPASRRGSTWAAPHSSHELDALERTAARRNATLLSMADCQSGRYKALNLAALRRHTTVEFRQHGGSIEGPKVVAWILLTQGLVEKAKVGRSRKGQVKASGDGFATLMRAAGLTTCKPHGQQVNPEHADRVATVLRYWRERANHFGVCEMGDNSATRSRQRTDRARARVARAVSAVETTRNEASALEAEVEALTARLAAARAEASEAEAELNAARRAAEAAEAAQ